MKKTKFIIISLLFLSIFLISCTTQNKERTGYLQDSQSKVTCEMGHGGSSSTINILTLDSKLVPVPALFETSDGKVFASYNNSVSFEVPCEINETFTLLNKDTDIFKVDIDGHTINNFDNKHINFMPNKDGVYTIIVFVNVKE